MIYKKVPFDFECGIELFTVCNYRCTYCSGPRVRKLVRRGRTREDVDRVIRFFNESGKTWLLSLSGGEPTLHPFFGELINGLKQQHYFGFFTNLSFDVERFMELVPADRVVWMKTALHPEADEETFLDKYETLFGFGYQPVLVMVSAPDTFERIRRVAEYCERRQFPFTLSVMEGPYRNKNYPNDYTETEAKFIERHTHEPGNLIRLFSKSPGGMNTFGLRCPAGQKNFVLDMESGVFRTCEAVERGHGNIYEGTFHPDAEATVCPAINSCVGYNRSIDLPGVYRDFYVESWNCLRLKEVKAEANYPENLFQVISPAAESSSNAVQKALAAIQTHLQDSRTLFWGAGVYGSKILYYLRQTPGVEKLRVVGFVDSLKDRQKGRVLDLPVYAPQDPILNEVDKILVTSYWYEGEILEQSARLGIETEVVGLHRDLLKPRGIEGSIF